jgi:hypothetical protein
MQSRIYACKFLFAGYKIYARKYYNYTESTKYVYPIVGLNTKYRTSIFSFRCLFGLSNWVVRFVAKKSPFDSKERKAGVTRTALGTGQVIKKKDAPCLGPRYRSARQSPVQNISAGNGPRWRFRARQTAATFSLFMHNMAALSFFQGGVLRIHTQLLFFAA